jgi:hypothetical protein
VYNIKMQCMKFIYQADDPDRWLRKEAKFKAREVRGVRRTSCTPQRQRAEAQRRNWTIYEAIKHHQGLLALALRVMPCFFNSAWKLLRCRPTWRAA